MWQFKIKFGVEMLDNIRLIKRRLIFILRRELTITINIYIEYSVTERVFNILIKVEYIIID
jgi:hypothetical protein